MCHTGFFKKEKKMGKMIFETLGSIYGSTLVSDVSEFVSGIMNAVIALLTDAEISALLGIFTGIAGTFMVLYFWIDLTDKASKDMFTFEKLVIALIKLFVGFAILLYLKDIITGTFKVAKGLYDMVEANVSLEASSELQFFPGEGNPDPSKWPKWSQMQKQFEDAGYKSTASTVGKHIGMVFKTFLPWAACWLAKIVSYFFVVSNAVTFIARIIFAPIGVSQCFEEGQRSSGIRYLKKMAADAISFAVILGIIYAGSKMQAAIMTNVLAAAPFKGKLAVSMIEEALSGKAVFSIVAVQLAIVGGITKANQLAGDIVGVS